MAAILVCTRKEDLLGQLGPLLQDDHQFAIVPHVTDAIRSLLVTRFDAVVFDIEGGMSERLDALPIIRRLHPRVPTLAISGQTSPDVEAGIRTSGVCCLLLRPLIPGELERHLAAALRWRAADPTGFLRPTDATPATAAR